MKKLLMAAAMSLALTACATTSGTTVYVNGAPINNHDAEADISGILWTGAIIAGLGLIGYQLANDKDPKTTNRVHDCINSGRTAEYCGGLS